MATCSLCGKEDLCFTCHYCQSIFCTEHRLPESHGCPALQVVKDDARRKLADSFTGHYDYDDEEQESEPIREIPVRQPRRRKRKRFSKQEIRDLSIASILVALVGFSMMGYPLGILNAFTMFSLYVNLGFFWFPLLLIGIFLLAFIGHELAHKFTAQHYGMWSEFRMTQMGYIISAIAIISSFPFFGTGIVYTTGTTSRENDGKTNLAGPLSNLIMGSVYVTIILVLVTVSGGLILTGSLAWVFGIALRYGIMINSILGLFNMIPLQPFDGGTVFAWNRYVWVLLTATLLTTLLIGYFVIPSIL